MHPALTRGNGVRVSGGARKPTWPNGRGAYNCKMDPDTLSRLVSGRLTEREIAETLGVSRATVRHWLRRYDLKTDPLSRLTGPCTPARCPWQPPQAEGSYVYLLGPISGGRNRSTST